MININSEELNNLEIIGSGSFGTVYKVNDKIAYKVYHDNIKINYGNYKKNPMLKYNKNKINNIKSKNNIINNTDFIIDELFINNMFKGVVIPFYNGNTLDKLNNISFKEKLNIVKKLLINAKELTDNKIYPQDYKSNNVILSNNELKIIDLDDIYTKYTILPNKIHKGNSIIKLNSFIDSYLSLYKGYGIPDNVKNRLLKKYLEVGKKYKYIDDYIKYLESEKECIIVDNNSNYDIELLRKYNPIYLLDGFVKCEYFFTDIINKFKNDNIDLYDFVKKSDLEKYIEENNIKIIKKL